MSDTNIIPLPTTAPIPTPFVAESYVPYRGKRSPLVIDNGSTNIRFGFCDATTPFTTTNVVSKYKERKTNKPLLLIGDAIDSESGARSQSKVPWEGDVLLNFDAMENVLDYCFVRLGIDASSVEHPVLMTERLCSPLHSRALTSELLFELYSVPSLTYCIDSVMSFYHNNLPTSGETYSAHGLVVSFNTASTSVIPIVTGRGIMSHAKRIPWGSAQASEYLLKLIQLKYPTFPTRVTMPQANWMFRTMCSFSSDYASLLRELKDPIKLKAIDRVIQFPFTVPTMEEKTEEELARIAERRKEQGKKLQEMAAEKRREKLEQKESNLQDLLELKGRKETTSKREYLNLLSEEDFDDEASLDDAIKKLEADIKKAKKKDGGDIGNEVEETPSFPLLDVPDAELDEEGLKEKKKQKLLKAGFDARQRAKQDKDREREEREAEQRREDQERENDFEGWRDKMRQEQETLMLKIKERRRRKAEMSDRKSAASQARMKSIAHLANDDRVPKKKRKGGGEDMFGADDADWMIYRKINTTAPSSDEEEELHQLEVVEQKLLAHDPTFTIEHTHAALSSQRSAFMNAFRPIYDEGDVQGKTRIHLSIERWRACETWFSPGMAGVDCAGLSEVVQNILANYDVAQKGDIVKNIVLTGSPAQLPGLAERLHASIRPILPPEMEINVRIAADPALDAWKGMADFAKTDEFPRVGISKAEYEEFGGERIRRWWGGNWNSSFTS